MHDHYYSLPSYDPRVKFSLYNGIVRFRKFIFEKENKFMAKINLWTIGSVVTSVVVGAFGIAKGIHDGKEADRTADRTGL